jgi:4-hydroxythreonine-4-phosphate dehydrogenase
MSEQLPMIGITIGDPAGIGPEIALKACLSGKLTGVARTVLIGSRKLLEATAGFCGLNVSLSSIAGFPTRSGTGSDAGGRIRVVDIDNVDVKTLQMGVVQPSCGKAAYQYIMRSVELARNGGIDAVATAPINKESFKAAGVGYIGHTEAFAGLTGTEDPLTMFEVDGMRIFFLTRHVSLLEAVRAVSRELVLGTIVRCIEELRKLGVASAPFAVAGLNPHCGENGLFGDEELNSIRPAVAQARERGYDVEGPVPADSVLHRALNANYSGVLAMYHDQGHIAAKTYDFEKTVSITTGLPILRTSVDHGTAFDIAGTGKASPESMIEAVRVAARYVSWRRRKSRSLPNR